jgi:hypothetical protein
MIKLTDLLKEAKIIRGAEAVIQKLYHKLKKAGYNSTDIIEINGKKVIEIFSRKPIESNDYPISVSSDFISSLLSDKNQEEVIEKLFKGFSNYIKN